MSDTKQPDDKTLTLGGRKTLSLRRTVESGTVRQNFPRGRSKPVLVEKKKRRTIVGGEAEAQAPEPAPVQEAPKPKPERAPAPKPAPAEAARGGVVLRTLTNEEKDARALALAEAKVREEEERRVAESEAKRRAVEEERLKKEREEAEKRQLEEDERRKAEEAAREQAEQEEAKRAPEAAAAPAAAPASAAPAAASAAPTREARAAEEAAEAAKAKRKVAEQKPVRRGEERRRGRLTISNALDENERSRSMAAMRRRREREKRAAGPRELGEKIAREVVLPETITIQELANRMAERAVDVIKLLMQQGQMLKINDVIDADTAEIIATEMGHTVKRVSEADVEEGLYGADDDPADLKPRPPVVTIMGHVDHGKTSLLDAIREANVVSGEAGGITQHIGAYQAKAPDGQVITFIDTPGHEAFTSMRARGAKVTDLVVLVVAADDGVMPQTVEAINHARAAEVPIIVAINKIDKPEADPSRVRNDLLRQDIVVESMGGDTLEVEVSALKHLNLEKLLEAIQLQAEVLELTANPDRPAEGIVIEAKLDKGRGPVATVLVQRGTLNVGDILVCGAEPGKVRALVDDHGRSIQSAGPATPVEVLGLDGTPEAGDRFAVVDSDARAREISDYRQRKKRERLQARGGGAKTSLEQMMSQLKEQGRAEFPLVLKADVQGSSEAIVAALDKLGTDEVGARVLSSGVGGITESDVTLAAASNAVILAFNVRANRQAREAAERDGVEIRYYNVIYHLVDDVKAAMSGLLSPTLREEMLGNAEILEVFNISKVGKVAGCRVTDGVVQRGASVRLIRDDVVIHEGKLSTLKRFKDEVREVRAGQECGMAFENYQDMRQGDVIECYNVEEIQRTL
ncbi:translation initiation factor IF-2 [Microbaculum marinisediminis]|uniref:Translation initiation factor IF-2 n=1 Tax=Microbaculum marinisediminis TaxID=2931392 RepID=A0AAW5QYB4_9HYPH|nr:translation initiation factor IF-2 [Microbaculum sp. A6E488]MCT8972127.1 translation initiation factor IF-2 [Microbaculum sp. A6E488]